MIYQNTQIALTRRKGNLPLPKQVTTHTNLTFLSHNSPNDTIISAYADKGIIPLKSTYMSCVFVAGANNSPILNITRGKSCINTKWDIL